MSRYRIKIVKNKKSNNSHNRFFYHPQFKMFGIIWVYFSIHEDIIDGGYHVEYSLNPMMEQWNEDWTDRHFNDHKNGYRSKGENRYKYL